MNDNLATYCKVIVFVLAMLTLAMLSYGSFIHEAQRVSFIR